MASPTGTVLGALAGASVGLIAIAVVASGNPHGDVAEFGFIYAPLAGAMIGAPVGAVVGGVRGLEVWERVR